MLTALSQKESNNKVGSIAKGKVGGGGSNGRVRES